MESYGNSGHPCLAPDLGGNVSQVLLLDMILALEIITALEIRGFVSPQM